MEFDALNPSRAVRARQRFNIDDFNQAVLAHGYDVRVDRVIPCACRTEQGNFQAECVSCLGTGRYVYDTKEIRCLVQSMNVAPDVMQWTLKNQGMASFTTRAVDRLRYLDRVFLLHGENFHGETVVADDMGVFCLRYPVKDMCSAFLFTAVGQRLTDVLSRVEKTDNADTWTLTGAGNANAKLTVLYSYMPTFDIVDMRREVISLDTLNNNKDRFRANFPTASMGVRSHLVSDLVREMPAV